MTEGFPDLMPWPSSVFQTIRCRVPRVGRALLYATAFACTVLAGEAKAGCGSAFCSLNTNWDVQGAWTEPGARFDLRYEFIDQDQPRAGRDAVGVGQISRHHDEVRTINRNLIAAFDYAFDRRWAVAVTLPVTSRSHSHIHNHHGTRLDEAWNFTRIGDARVTGRYRFVPETATADRGAFGVQFGLKLPTGEFNVANEDGDVAERSLQPGSGTTDAILGAFYHGELHGSISWFAEGVWQRPLDARQEYRPGERLGMDAGVRYPLGGKLSLIVQVNALWKGRDSGQEAEPEDSGGTFLHFGPGLSLKVDDATQVYGFVQVPLYQYVNGVQLTADWSAVIGISRRF